MKLSKLLEGIKVENVVGDIDGVNVRSLTIDSRSVTKGTLYFCLSGYTVDGHEFAETAAVAGAVAIVCERVLEVDVPQVVVPDARIAMALVAGAFYGNPARKLKFITATGTNGKTSTTYFLRNILKTAGYKVGLFGTIGIFVDEIKLPTDLTTPDPIEFHRILKQMVEVGVQVVVMEASAHAITLNKLYGIVAEAAILTNITQDHIDFYGTFEKYAEAKLGYFTALNVKNAVVNVDTEHGRQLLKDAKIPVFTYGLENPAGVFAVNCMFSVNGTDYFLNLFDHLFQIETKMLGKFNLYNALGAACAAKVFGVEPHIIAKGLSTILPVEGRFNVINLPNKTNVIIDYAHTPDGLSNILYATRGITKNKIISVFGCGGNRDSLKRPIMGKISAELADFTVITSDNPRFEDPAEIITQIEAGTRQVCDSYICIIDRRTAIGYALSLLEAGDAMVLSGKGAENYLDIMGIKHPYNDHVSVLEEYKAISEEEKLC